MFDVNKYSVFSRTNNIQSNSGSNTPYQSSAYDNAVNQYVNKKYKNKEETKRSSLDRFIDAISVGNYLGAGIVKGIVDDDSTVLGNIGKAIDASNPFGDGNETGEFSYTDTLDEFWNPTSTIGKIAKGAVGFAGDVFLDPTTYLTLGIGTALKGSKGALKLAGIADKVIDADKAFDVVKKFSDANGLQLSDDILKQQADVLLQKHNKLLGIGNGGRDITASLANAPFGEKIFGNLSKKSKTLATADMVAGFGDKTIAPLYQKIRSDVMKSKFADLFSNNARLYKKALDNPDELYKFMRSEAMQKAQTGKHIKFKDKILTQGQNLAKLDLTPDEQKQIRTMLEDPSTFNLVFSASIKEDKATIEALKQKFGYLQDDFSKNMDSYLSELKSYDELMNISKVDEDRILSQIADSEDELKMLTENYEAEKTAIIDSIKARRDEMITDLASIPAPVLSQAGKLEEVNEILLRESERLTDGKFEPINPIDKVKPEFISEIDLEINGTTSSNATKLKKQIQDKGYVLYKDKARAYAFKKNNPKWNLKETSNGVMLIAPKVVKIGDEVFKEINDNNVGDFIKLLNENYDMKISPLTDKSQIKVFYDMINSGKGKKAIMYEYSLRKMRLTGYDARLYSKIIAPTLGYKNFAKEIEKPLAELKHIRKSKGALTDSEQKKFNRFLRIYAQRNKMVKEYYSKFPDVDSLNKHIAEVSNARAKQAMADKNFDVVSTIEEILEDRMVEKRLKFFDDERKVNRQGDTISDELYRYEPVLDKDEIEFISVDIKDVLFPNAKVGDGLSKHMNNIADKVPTVIENNYKYRVKMSGYDDVKVPYIYDLSEEARAKIYKQAKYLVDNEVDYRSSLKNINKQIKRDISLQDMIKAIDDVKEITEKIDAVIPNPSEYSKSFVEVADEVDELTTKLYEKATDDVDFMKQVDEVKANINNLNKQLVDIKQSRVQLKQLLDSEDNVDVDKYLKEFDGLSNEIKTREETLNRHIRFLDSANINPENFDNIDKLYKIDIMDVDDKIKETVKMLRESFYKMGADELAIGKLKSKQFDKWAYSYLPHILTEEGREFIEKNADTIGKSIPGFDAKKIGYGRTFNPFSKERSLNNIVLNGKPIENPNIDELNEFFQSNFPELKGNKVFIDNISDLYIKRALKHADVMYDHKYMNDMLGTFGTRYNGGFVDGEKIVMNYGVLRERVMTEARKQFKQSWDEYDLQNDISKNIMADYPKGTKEFNQLMKRERLNYMQKLTEDVLRVGYNLPPQSLHDLSTPMIELTKEQADNLYSKFGEASEIYTVNDLIVDKANQSRKYQIKKDNNQLLDMYDKFTHFIKLNQTTVMPSFHVRNKISNTFNNWLAIGSDAVNTKFQKTAYKAIKSDGKIDDILIVTKKDGSKIEMPWSDVYQKARQYGVLDEGFFQKDLGTSSAFETQIGKLKPEHNPFNTKKFKPYVLGSKVGTEIESSDRLLHFASQLSRGMDYQEASESVNKYLFDYSDLTDFEKNVMKRVFPYYTWLRKNAPLQLESMLEQPEKFRDVNKVMTGISNMNSPEDRMEERYTANFAQDWLQTPFTGKTGNPIIFNPNLPMQDINRIPDITDLGESARQLISQMNPLLKVPLEQATNKNFYMDSPITSEGGNETVDRLMHILSQLSGVNTAKNIVTNEGTDRAMQVLNALTGLKFSDYNYEGYKNMIKGGGEE